MYFTGNDGLQNMFVYQSTFGILQLQKYKNTDTDIIFLVGSQKVYVALLFLHNIPIFCIA